MCASRWYVIGFGFGRRRGGLAHPAADFAHELVGIRTERALERTDRRAVPGLCERRFEPQRHIKPQSPLTEHGQESRSLHARGLPKDPLDERAVDRALRVLLADGHAEAELTRRLGAPHALRGEEDGIRAERVFVARTDDNPEVRRLDQTETSGERMARLLPVAGHEGSPAFDGLEGENVTALGATAGKHAAAALGAAANQEAVRTGTLDLGRLVGTFGSHDGSLLGKRGLIAPGGTNRAEINKCCARRRPGAARRHA